MKDFPQKLAWAVLSLGSFLFFTSGTLLFSPSQASAATCSVFKNGGDRNYFFDNFEDVEYANNLLVLHFKLKTPYNDGRPWTINFAFFSDECQGGTLQSFQKTVLISPGVQYFSARFTSPTRFEIWNDEANVKELCANCTQDVPVFPGYYELIILGSIDSGASTFRSSSYRISNTASGPPLKTTTLPTPQNCRPFQTGGFLQYFFDNYEHTEYINGFLAYHFRFKTPYNDGRSWSSLIVFHNQNCVVAESYVVGQNKFLNTKIAPYTRYYSLRFSSPTHYDIWNDETNQKEICDACAVDIPATVSNKAYSFVSIRGAIDGDASFFFSTALPIHEAPPTPDPVIIIPGILGSSDKNGVWVIDPIFHTYDDLIATLKANGYAEGKDLFTMPYDWRQSNVLTALQLRDKINEVQNICNCDKVDLVAHSMGGLVARQYIQSDKYENDVDQLIFLGTPHLGAPFAYLTWEGGEIGTKTGDLIQRTRDQFAKFIFAREAQKAGFGNLFDYVRNKPLSSVQELMPIYDYLRDKSTSNLRVYPDNYPQNVFLENLKTGVLNLFDKGINITNIVGELGNTSTLNAIRVIRSSNLPLWENGYPDGFDGSTIDKGFEFGFGDGTVPKNSGEFIASDLNEISAEHNTLPTKAEGLVFKKLTGKDAASLVDTGFSLNLKLLLIKILSPIDVMVIAPDGKRIGKDFSTNSEVNEIDGAFYSGFLTDDEYLTIPNPLDGEYKIETKGTGAGGLYTIAVGYIIGETLVEVNFNGATAPDAINNLDILVDNENPESIGFMVTPNDIIKDIEMAFNSGWITKKGIKEGLIKKIRAVITLEEKIKLLEEQLPGNPKIIKKIENIKQKIDKILAKSFLQELEKQHPKNINDQAYNLLKEDINWLLNN